MKAIQRGFTLVELMITLAIIGIIAAIAYPAYTGYIEDTYKGQAMADLEVCALGLERYYGNNTPWSYLNATIEAPAACGSSTTCVCVNQSPSEGTAQYTVSFSSGPSANNFTLRAAKVGETCADSTGNCAYLTADGTKGWTNPTP